MSPLLSYLRTVHVLVSLYLSTMFLHLPEYAQAECEERVPNHLLIQRLIQTRSSRVQTLLAQCDPAATQYTLSYLPTPLSWTTNQPPTAPPPLPTTTTTHYLAYQMTPLTIWLTGTLVNTGFLQYD